MEDLDIVSEVIIKAVDSSMKLYHDLAKAGYEVKPVLSPVVEQMRIGQQDKTDHCDAQLLANYGA